MRSRGTYHALNARGRRLAILGTVALLGGSFFSLAGYAQSQQSAPNEQASEDEQAGIQEVIVTGSRVRAPDEVSISPITSVTPLDFQQMGAIDVEQALRDMPEAFPGRGNTTNNNGSGDTSANLRNLGPQRTLVLVDGQRFVSDDQKTQVDLDVIPPGMIERIDVVTGGASAVYGADAIAGVVNIILKKNFNGLQVDAQAGEYSPQGDGKSEDVSLMAGTDFGEHKGNVTTFAGFTNRNYVLKQDRDWAFPSLTSNGTALVPTTPGVIPGGRELNSGDMFTDSRTLVPYDGSTYQRSYGQYIITPQRRFDLGINGHYDISPWANLYFFGTYVQNNVDRSTSIGAVEDTFSINYGNPLLSDQERSVIFSPGPHSATDIAQINLQKAMLSTGNDQELDTYNTYEFRMGLTGPIDTHFNYDVSAQYGETQWLQILTGDISPSRFQQGLLVNPDGTCMDPSNGCVPIDIFTAQPSAITSAQANFFKLTQQANTVTEQELVTGSISGDLGRFGIKSPIADKPVNVALGGEYRHEYANYMPDDTLATGNNLMYGAIPPERGDYSVTEGFFEGRVPLVEDKPWAKSIEVEAGYRYSDYNLAGRTNTYKYGGLWQPTTGIRFRGAFEHAVRAPSIDELFSPPQANSGGTVDPCFSNNGAAPTASRTLCIETGVPGAAYGNPNLQCPGGNCKVLNGGNPELRPETSNSVTFGVSLTPSALPGFEASIDYYNIKVQNAISEFGTDADVIIADCYGTGPGQNPTQNPNSVYCQHIQRSPAGDIWSGGFNGSVGYVSMLNENTGLLHVSGIDFALGYRTRLSNVGVSAIPGSVSASSKISYVESYDSQTDQTSPVFQCVGTFGLTCGQPIPHWRSNTRFTWSPNNQLSLALRWRLISQVILDQDFFTGTLTDPPDHSMPTISYFDLSAFWTIRDKVNLRAGVTDLFNRQPPTISSSIASAEIFGFANTFPGTYDIGRVVFIGATVNF
jgi:iron complex outermembrane receptor protein